jgi:hypothetical protein
MRYAIILSLLAASILPVQAAPPTESSVSEMLRCLQVDKLLSQALSQMTEGMTKAMESRLQSTIGEHQLSDAQKAAVDRFRARFAKTLKEELSPSQIRAIYVQCYKETFTQDEVDGVIAFYKSPPGMAMSEKYPQVMQRAQALMQTKIQPMGDKVQAAMEDMIKDLEKAQTAEAEKEKKE